MTTRKAAPWWFLPTTALMLVDAYCEELPAGFRSGIEELDDEERGVFVMCWAKAGD